MSVRKGDKIKVEYESLLENGEVFDSSKHGEHSHPLEFVVGSGTVIEGFDNAVLDMEIRQEKEFKLSSKEAYGDYKEELVQKMPRTMLPLDKPRIGMVILLQAPDGNQFPVKILDINSESVTLDLNHPLAGKNLIFRIKLIDISTNIKNDKEV